MSVEEYKADLSRAPLSPRSERRRVVAELTRPPLSPRSKRLQHAAGLELSPRSRRAHPNKQNESRSPPTSPRSHHREASFGQLTDRAHRHRDDSSLSSSSGRRRSNSFTASGKRREKHNSATRAANIKALFGENDSGSSIKRPVSPHNIPSLNITRATSPRRERRNESRSRSKSPRSSRDIRHKKRPNDVRYRHQSVPVGRNPLLDYEQAIATFDFHDDDQEKLSFNKGDIIIIIDDSEVGHGWLEGQNGSRRGWFPANRVERIRRKQFLIALYDMNASSPGFLSFKAGDVITLLESYKSWYTGELNGKIGKIPCNYVKRVQQQLEDPERIPTLKKPSTVPSGALDVPRLRNSNGVASEPLPLTQRGLRHRPTAPDGRAYSSSHVPPLPFVKVTVKRARRLPRVVEGAGGVEGEGGVVPDVYVDVLLGAAHGSTDVAEHTGTPEWLSEFYLPAATLSLLNSMLKVSVWHQGSDELEPIDVNDNDVITSDKGTIARHASQRAPNDTFIGELHLPLLYLKDHQHKAAWFALQHKANRGDVRIKLLYEGNDARLSIEVVEGRGLVSAVAGKALSSPYVALELGEFRAQTPSLASVAAPKWSAPFVVRHAARDDDLIVSVYDDANAHKRLSLPVNASPLSASDTIMSRVLIGEVILPLRFLTKGQQIDEWFPLTARALNTKQGDIFLEIDFVDDSHKKNLK